MPTTPDGPSDPRPGLEMLDLCRTMRDTSPVVRDPASGAYQVFRYDDAVSVLSDHDTFSSDFSAVFPEATGLMEGHIGTLDPPRHQQLRRLVSQAFTPRAVAQLEERVERIAEELLDRVPEKTELELVEDIAYALPLTVITEMLGVPAEDRPLFKQWADQLYANGAFDTKSESSVGAAKAFHDYLLDLVVQRRKHPSPGLLADLVAAEVDGERLTDREIAGFATVLLLAGHVTVTLWLGNTFLCLLEHPDAERALRADPDAIPAALEEVLRFRSPVGIVPRVTKKQVELRGTTIEAGQVVVCAVLSANHDERQFDRPDEFLIDRNPNPHIAFSKGIHFCFGAPLARLEARVALRVLLRRFRSFRLDPDRPMLWHPDPTMSGPKSLPLLVEPA
ncbi:cytochrome P450 [Kitasatospora sp. NPDC050463]|uniref:cytochrome P450 n=1 Tax=Kitasatospora sp. NPDC050463 TaxID=3155786 RepID=UPI0033C53FD4